MKHNEFAMGADFLYQDEEYRVTDIGSRVIVAIRVSSVNIYRDGKHLTLTKEEAEAEGWFKRPYALVEHIFDENEMPLCKPVKP